MGVQIGLMCERADVAVEVASVALRAGACLTPIPLSGARQDDQQAGSRPVSAAGPPVWLEDAVDMLLLDFSAVGRGDTSGTSSCDPSGRPLKVPTAVICRPGEVERARDAAARIGCSHVVELPAGASWLTAALTPRPPGGLLGVVGAAGGVGTTTLAIACAVGAGEHCLLVDADPNSVGLDLALGLTDGSGARWEAIPDSDAPLDRDSLWASLPRVGRVSIVTGPVAASAHAAGAGGPLTRRMSSVLDAGRADFARSVVDLGRGAAGPGLLGPGDTVVLVLRATVSGIVAGRRALSDLPADRVVALVRPSGWLPAAEVGERLAVSTVLEIPRLRRAQELADCGDLVSGRTGRVLRRLGQRVWEAAS